MKLKPFILLAGLLGASITAASAATTVTLNPTADTYLRNNENQSYGATTSILAGSHASLNGLTNLFRFNIPAPVGPDTVLESVTLTLTSTGNGAGSSVTLTVFELAAYASGWVEGTGDGGIVNGATSARYFVTPTTDWTGSIGARTAGTDYVNTSLATFTGNASTIGTGSLGFTSTAALLSRVDAIDNAGGALNLWVGTPTLTGANDFFRIASRETAGTASDPVLTLNYIPEPSSALSLLAGVGLMALRRRRSA